MRSEQDASGETLKRLHDKVALVTGAAGQLGRRICASFAAEGAAVWAADLDEDACEAAVSALPGGAHRAAGFDISDPAAVKAAFERVKAVSGRIDVLVNNAGIAVFSPFWERDFEDFMRVMKVNAGGSFLCTRAAAEIMRDTGSGGSIVNIGSIYGMVSSDPRIYTDCGRVNSECYSASKAAVIQMTRYFAAQLAPFKIRVNCVSPGGVFNRQGADFVKNYSWRTPMGRMADESEIPPAILFLASDESSYVTGQNIAVEGGFTAW